MDDRQIVGLIFLVIGSPYVLACTVWFWIRRHHHPILGREPKLCGMALVVIFAWYVSVCLEEVLHDVLPCVVNIWSRTMIYLSLCIMYTMRAWCLYFRYELATERLSLWRMGIDMTQRRTTLSIPHDSDTPSTWFVDHRYMVDPNVVIRVTWMLLVIPLIMLLVFTPFFDYMRNTDVSCPWDMRSYITLGIVVSNLSIIVWLAVKIRRVADGHFIVDELRVTALLALAVVFATVLIHDTPEDTTTGGRFISHAVCILLGICCTCLMPVFFSYEYQRARTFTRNRTATMSFDSLWDDTDAMMLFERFLTMEFCVENLLFLREAKKFRATYDERSIVGNRMYARNIWAQFVMLQAPFEVNLSQKRRDYVRDRLLDARLNIDVNPNLMIGRESFATTLDSYDLSRVIHGTSSTDENTSTPPPLTASSSHDAANDSQSSSDSSVPINRDVFSTACGDLEQLLRLGAFTRFVESDLYRTFVNSRVSDDDAMAAIFLDPNDANYSVNI